MRLIDILVEKTKKGEFEWPEGVTSLCQGHDRQLERLEGDDSFGMNVFIEPLIKKHRKWAFTASECDAEIVTREQYKAALKQSVWDGTGAPPVGVECERSWCGDKWSPCTVLFVSNETVVVKLATREASYGRCEVAFRPIRSEREEAIHEIASMIGCGTFYEDAERIYDAGYRKQ